MIIHDLELNSPLKGHFVERFARDSSIDCAVTTTLKDDRVLETESCLVLFPPVLSQSLNRAYTSTDCLSPSVFYPPDVGSVEGLAYHRGWDTLYWTSYTTSTITRHTVDQSRPQAYDRNTVVTMSGDDHPRAFVLDECQG